VSPLTGLLWGLGLTAAWALDPALVILQGPEPATEPLVDALLITLVRPPAILREHPVDALLAQDSSAQLASLRPLLQEPEVLATAWVDPRDPAVVRLVVVFASEGRGVVHVVEEPAGPGAEQAVALATRELLSAVVLVAEPGPEPEPESEPEPRPESVEAARSPVEPQVASSPPRGRWARLGASGGLSPGGSGAPAWGCLTAGYGLGPTQLSGLELGVSLRRGQDATWASTGASLFLAGTVRFALGPLLVAPDLRVDVGVLAVDDRAGHSSVTRYWLPQVRAGAGLGGFVTRGRTWVGPDLRVQALLVEGEVRHRSSGQVGFSTGRVEGQAGLQIGRWL